ncbi:MAG: hypothetical protein ACK5MK_01600, partial [Dysgonomonas sp.]
LSSLIDDWRSQWNNSHMPFAIIQNNYFQFAGETDTLGRALIMEEQFKTVKSTDNTVVVCTSDIYDEAYVHQSQKNIIGTRAAQLILKKSYGLSDLPVEAPTVSDIEYKDSKALVFFENAEYGLYPSHLPITGFEIAGEDRVFHKADAIVKIQSNELDSLPTKLSDYKWFFDLHNYYPKSYVEVSSPLVKNPKAIRYGFKNLIRTNLSNTFGIPAYPFRSDDWIERKRLY